MISIYRLLYSIVFLLALVLGSVFSSKLRRYFKMRLLNSKSTEGPTRPHLTAPPGNKKVILVHAASGEAEYAFPVISRLKQKHPQSYIVCTYYSPSYADKIQAHPDIDQALPLPFDFPGPIKNLLHTLKPEMILISRTDLWPEFLHQARLQKIPVILFSRTESETRSWFKILIKRWIYKYLHTVSVVSEVDAQNAARFLPPSVNLKCHGDTRWDQVFEKIKPFKDQTPPLGAHTAFFVAGSTWEPDLEPLLKAWRPAFGTLVIAPHEIHPAQIEKLQKRLEALNLRSHLYSQTPDLSIFKKSEGDVLIIDEMGVLFKIYMGAYGALIGGSFKGKVHSVMEALACQTPVIVGPYYKNNREAMIYSQKPLLLGTTDPLKVVNVCMDHIQMQKVIAGLHQRFLDSTDSSLPPPPPLCTEMEVSPSDSLVDDLLKPMA